MKRPKALYTGLTILLSFFIYSQSTQDRIALLVPEQLKENTNAVLRFDKKIVTINDFDLLVVNTHRIVTIMNEYGDVKNWNAAEMYDDNTRIKTIEAIVYDAAGNTVKKFKKKDFKDQSAVSGGTLYSDSRIKYLSYYPVNYPYTIEYMSEVEYRSTAFIPSWQPIDNYYLSVQHSEYELINNSEVKVKTKAQNLEAYNIINNGNKLLVAENLSALKYEAYSPSLESVVPNFKVALEQFKMEGVDGLNEDWHGFGKWMYDKLLSDTRELPIEVINEVKDLTENSQSDIEKAKLIYEYVQNKTRYISVQVGIGGWKPSLASDVDELGYGDCKGLVNYTMALLSAVGVESYYTVIYGGNNIQHIDEEFSSTQGNHVILSIPRDDDYVFLECTSQTSPFGLIAGFTDNRKALLITPEGGKIISTTKYFPNESAQITSANIAISTDAKIRADVKLKTTGLQYNLRQGIETETERDQIMKYKNQWDYISDAKVEQIQFKTNQEPNEFIEEISLSSDNYASKLGSRIVFQPNVFNRNLNIPPRYTKRTLDFEIERGFKDIDEYVITYPEGMTVEVSENSKKIDSKFGLYEFSLEQLDATTLKYKRVLQINDGQYTKADYDEFRAFNKTIARLDKTKIIFNSDK